MKSRTIVPGKNLTLNNMPAEKNNKYAQKWDEKTATEKFILALEYAEQNDSCLCLEDAIFHCGIPYSTYYYLAEKHEDLENIKRDTQRAVLRRVNRGSLKGTMNSTAGIWRMKMLGEQEKQEIKLNMEGSIPLEAWVEAKNNGENKD